MADADTLQGERLNQPSTAPASIAVGPQVLCANLPLRHLQREPTRYLHLTSPY